jgi:hypothetical protein
MVILQRPRLEFQTADRTTKCFEVIESVESTFASEPGRPELVLIILKGLPVANRLPLVKCVLPKTIIVQGGNCTWTLEINRLKVTITPTGLVLGLHGEFTKDGLKVFPGSDFRGDFPTYEVKLEAWIISPVKIEYRPDHGLTR